MAVNSSYESLSTGACVTNGSQHDMGLFCLVFTSDVASACIA